MAKQTDRDFQPRHTICLKSSVRLAPFEASAIVIAMPSRPLFSLSFLRKPTVGYVHGLEKLDLRIILASHHKIPTVDDWTRRIMVTTVYYPNSLFVRSSSLAMTIKTILLTWHCPASYGHFVPECIFLGVTIL